MRTWPIALGVLAFFSGCSARTGLDDGTGGSGAPSSGSTGTLVPEDLCEPDGIRVCHDPECPAPQDCKGMGCTPASDRDSFVPSESGVCWTDIQDWPNEECFACPDGDACVHRGADELHCVPLSVCVSLAALGAANVCTYADKSPFTNQPLATSSTCPVRDHSVCGGICGDCASGFRCTGRSATRPYGLCAPLTAIDKHPRTCSYEDSGPATVACAYQNNYYCAVHASGNERLARKFGVCMQLGPCSSAAKAMPLHCLDPAGNEHAQ